MNFEGDHLCFEIYLPDSHLNEMLELLIRDPNTQIEVGFYLLSFSYEVDAAMRDLNHPQYLFIEDQAPAPVSFVNTSSLVGAKLITADENLNDTNPQPSPLDLSSVTRALGRLTFAMWVLVAIIGFLLIK
jgi:hypothetical protein